MMDYIKVDSKYYTITPNICYISTDDACKLIHSSYQHTSKLPIKFDFRSEGFQKTIIHCMDDIVQTLVNEYDYDINTFHYHSGACPIETNKNLYQSLPFEYLPKNFLLDCTFEGSYFNRKINRQTEPVVKSKKFLSMNEKPRTHRRFALSWLIKQGLLTDSFYSFDCSKLGKYPTDLIEKYNAVTKDITNTSMTPMILSKYFDLNNQQDRIKNEDIYYFDNSYFSFVQETLYDDLLDHHTEDIGFYHTIFITEKTYRAIYFKHPFVLLGVPGSLSGLRECGYKTFSPYIDETYDEINDPVLRLEAALNEVKRLCSLSDNEWLSIQREISPILEYNYIKLTSGIKPLQVLI